MKIEIKYTYYWKEGLKYTVKEGPGDVLIRVRWGVHTKGEAKYSGRTEMSVVLKDSATN